MLRLKSFECLREKSVSLFWGVISFQIEYTVTIYHKLTRIPEFVSSSTIKMII